MLMDHLYKLEPTFLSTVLSVLPLRSETIRFNTKNKIACLIMRFWVTVV